MRTNKTLQVPAKSGTIRADQNSQGVSTPLHDKIYSSHIFCANVGRKRACNLIPSSVCVGRARRICSQRVNIKGA